MAKRFMTWLLLFVGITLVLQSFRQSPDEQVYTEDIIIHSQDNSYAPGDDVIVTLLNTLDQTISIPSDCPSEPLRVERYSNGVWEQRTSDKGLYVSCNGQKGDQPVFYEQALTYTLAPKELVTIDYAPWKHDLFEEVGKYRVVIETTINDVEKTYFTEFEVAERGFFKSVGYHAFFRPMYNLMLFLTSIMPGYNFGLAIVALTLIIRLALLVPNQKALKAQRSMMKIQPELDAIKKKYHGNQEKIAQETMLLWKKHKVSPVGGCLPLLLQLPIMIALFYSVKSGFTPYEGYILYPFLSHIDLTAVSTDFFGILDLQKVNAIWLPLLVGLMQFFQLKLSFARRKNAQHGNEVVEVGDNKPEKNTSQDPMQMMSKSMMYFMPVMIALMVASLPSAVGIYMMVSTLFGIGQQYAVNRNT